MLHPRLAAFGRIALLAAAAALSGCSSSQEVMREAGATLSGRLRLAPLREAPPAGAPTVQVLPISGMPVTIADGLYHDIRTEASLRGIRLVHRLEEPARWRIQGHLVALGHSNSTTVIYTWDIHDASGRPVHRISGQETSASGVSGDPWGAVDGETRQRIAKRAVRELVAWLNQADH